ncbi:response regulator transcription factor [Streptomyces sp. HPF1205]|uniref:response regulator transcription factor n=1 Tax=Streptomyces sp. HPF1205 TaxID=2873262 RepID=UPI001CED624E|nr:response regulator transcription factor [Streptomyces sp. HPF1205]
MLSVLVTGPYDAGRRELERRAARIGEFVLLPDDNRRPPAADVLLVAADREGFTETRRIAVRAAAARTAALIVVDEPFEELLSVVGLGAGGIVLGSAPDRELADCAALVARRGTVVPEQVLEGERLRGGSCPCRKAPGQDPREALARLSTRELEVLALVGAGRSNAEIARLLWLSSNTVRSHVQRLMRKLEVRNRLCLVILAHEVRLMIPAAAAADAPAADVRAGGPGDGFPAGVPAGSVRRRVAAGSDPVHAPHQRL